MCGDADLPCPSAAIPMPAALLCVVRGRVPDSEEASDAKADEASEEEMGDNIDVLPVQGTPPVQRAAKRRAKTLLDRLAKRICAAPRDLHAQCVARENRQRARSDDEAALSCTVLLTMSERY